MQSLNGNSTAYRLLCVFLYKKIVRAYNRMSIYYDKDNMNADKMKGNLILCNHDLWPIDILIVPFVLHEFLHLDVSIVTSRNYMDYYVNKELFADYNLIPVGNSVDKIIEEMRNGRTVVLFLNWTNINNIYNNTSIKRIIELTQCSPILLTLDLSDCVAEKYKNHPLIYSIMKARYIKAIKDRKLKYTNEAETHIKNITGSRLRIMQFILGSKINLVVTSSPSLGSYNDTCNNIYILDRLKLKGKRKINYKTYSKLTIPKEIINKYLKNLKYIF